MKAIPYIIFGICATIYIRYVVRKALNEPPEEERCYSSSVAAIMDGAMSDDDDDNWYDDWVEQD